ncbi:hypothetical protein [Falsiroseomonas sp. E2-1-a20]|uniref:hypothetical protein n=1 Tax=Falsiroseomonas sp. E2-1-a20 TaxID=3239300 RepID=UPI003F319DF2
MDKLGARLCPLKPLMVSDKYPLPDTISGRNRMREGGGGGLFELFDPNAVLRSPPLHNHLKSLLPVPISAPWREPPARLQALARAAAALARLDQASAQHKLLPALLHRARLDAVRRQAAVDGFLIDPWHLAALTEGLRPRRLAGAQSLAEAGGGVAPIKPDMRLGWLTAGR